MSVILQLANFTASQGWSDNGVLVGITNSGSENIETLKLKVIDSAVFTVLKGMTRLSYSQNCLNTFNTSELRIYNGSAGSWRLPAGDSADIALDITIKGGAPVQVHNLQCEFQYVVY